MRKEEAEQKRTDRLTLNVEDAGKLLGLAKGSAYAAVHRGEIPSLRIGGRLLVPRVQLARLLEGRDR